MNNPPQKLSFGLTEAIVDTLREPIIILDKKLQVVIANRAFYSIFKVKYKEVHGKFFHELGSGEWNIPALNVLFAQIIPQKAAVENYEVSHDFGKLGARVMIVNAREIKFGHHFQNIFVSISDVTNERKAQHDKENLMLQKDTLLKEMRHRIANSLQLIASIILLKTGSIRSKVSRAHLEDAHDRILSVATVQRNLNPTSKGSLVPIVDYLKILCESLARSMIGGRKPITIKVTGGVGKVTPDEAIGLGLITTELVMNALKHAFPKGEGQITVVYESTGKSWNLSVGDDGVGLLATDMAKREGLGTSIVESLATQLNAEIQRKSTARGTVVSISRTKN